MYVIVLLVTLEQVAIPLVAWQTLIAVVMEFVQVDSFFFKQYKINSKTFTKDLILVLVILDTLV